MQHGRSIASLRIYVERAIGRMKQYKILTGVFPLKMARISNQIVTVCSYLSNFHPALVPVPAPSTSQESENSSEVGDDESLNTQKVMRQAPSMMMI